MFSTLGPLLAHSYLGIYIRFLSDDFCFSADAKSMGIIKYVINNYKEWSGRFSEGFFETFMSQFESTIFYDSFFLIFFWIIVLTMIIRIVIPRNQLNWAYAPLLIALTILFTTIDLLPDYHIRRTINEVSHTWDKYPAVLDSIYWITGRHSLVPPLILATLIAGLITYFSRGKYHLKDQPYFLVMGCIIAFVSGGFGETFVVLQTTSLIILLFLLFFFGSPELKKRLIPFILLITLFSILAMIIIVLAPGNKIRSSYFVQTTDPIEIILIAYTSMKTFLDSMFKWPGNILTIIQLLTITAYFGLIAQNQNDVNKWSNRMFFWVTALLPIMALVLLFSSFFPSAYGLSKAPPARAMISPIYFTVCIIAIFGYCLGILISNKIVKWSLDSRFINFFLSCTFIVFALNSLRDTINILANEQQLKIFSTAFDNREKLIIEAKNKGENIVYVPKLNHFMLGSLKNDSTYYVNECVSNYYGITVIVDTTLPTNDIFYWKK